ncbi:hypothetical protein R1flu_015611 [Riccia fluitans]|uniref:Uncharacterized protein n=1 Tax=Riccia fluitans TaxID=41844 RepID=A0ABD1YKB1_9MARC
MFIFQELLNSSPCLLPSSPWIPLKSSGESKVPPCPSLFLSSLPRICHQSVVSRHSLLFTGCVSSAFGFIFTCMSMASGRRSSQQAIFLAKTFLPLDEAVVRGCYINSAEDDCALFQISSSLCDPYLCLQVEMVLHNHTRLIGIQGPSESWVGLIRLLHAHMWR